MADSKMLNIGCGKNYHLDWINLDISPADPNVLAADINNGLPFASDFATVCYSSHVLEHLDKGSARNLIAECFRVLKSGGVIRLVMPDMEALVREYLSILDAVTAGDETRDLDYDWIMLELFDQFVRYSPGGEMELFLTNLDENNRSFVRSRIGVEADMFWPSMQVLSSESQLNSSEKKIPWRERFNLKRERVAGWLVYLIAGKSAYRNYRIGIFRSSGEVHQWMYDRYSIKRLLGQAGFVNVKICAADESRIPEYEKYSLDVLKDIVRKPDSLYVEASKP